MIDRSMPDATRRDFLLVAGALAGGVLLAGGSGAARASPAAMQDAIRKVVGNATVRNGRVKLELPPLSENGNAVALAVSVESPMTASDHVRAIHVFAEKNPQPNVVSMTFGPRSGRATLSTRIRLSDTQSLIAIAQMSDGSFWSGTAHVLVTIAACTEEV
jgi:sulfur-oxidizing protein SoxY